jgi:hypothetical protein
MRQTDRLPPVNVGVNLGDILKSILSIFLFQFTNLYYIFFFFFFFSNFIFTHTISIFTHTLIIIIIRNKMTCYKSTSRPLDSLLEQPPSSFLFG